MKLRSKIIIIALLLSLVVGVFSYWFNFIYWDLPEVSVSTLTNIPQKTIITDRNWELLYTFFEEDREYVNYENIPPHLIMAFLSAEDRQYWEHDGIDKWWLVRAVINNVKRKFFNSELSLQWASTISQQLIKNTYLTSERTFKRKLQEIIITRKVYALLEDNFKDEFPDYTRDKIDLLVKKKILELYLNIIFLWNNSYGVSSAAQHYFNKDIEDLSLLESSIIAWLPQAPSLYNPYVHRTNMMGDWQINDTKKTYFIDQNWDNSEVFLNQIERKIRERVKWWELVVDDSEWISKLRKGKFTNNDISYSYSYSPWRKDYVLRSMYQEWYIHKEEVIDSFLEWIDVEFSTSSYDIQAPHFVFFVKDFLLHNKVLEDLQLSLNDLLQWGYTIRTSLDMGKQKALEEAATSTKSDLLSKWGSSRSLLHIDSKRWEILAYLWSQDYYDSEIDWQYDLIHARRQQWSTLKPFVYAKLMENFPITTQVKISDWYMKTTRWHTPRNADGLFGGLVTMSYALNNSRNLTAIRAYLASWWQSLMKPFFKKLWFTTIQDSIDYGYTLSLGAAEESIYHLAQAYLQFSSPHDLVPTINPILSITWPQWENIYTNNIFKKERVIPKWIAYEIRNVLKLRKEVSPYWRNTLIYEWINWPYAIKTWTSDIKKDNQVLPKDGYVVVYTPNDTLISRAWNVDSKPLNNNVLWSQINKPFIQKYINNLWSIGNNAGVWLFWWEYDRPNDLNPDWTYINTKYSLLPNEIQQILRK